MVNTQMQKQCKSYLAEKLIIFVLILMAGCCSSCAEGDEQILKAE